MQELQPAKDIDLTCYKTLPTKAITCSQVGPVSLEWPVALPAESDQSSLSLSHEDPNDGHPENTFPALPHLRWRRDALQPIQVQQDTAVRDTCGHFFGGGLRCVTWNTRGLVGFFLHKETESSSSTILGSSLKTTTLSVSRRHMGRMSFSRLFRCGPVIQIYWCVHSWQRECRRIGHLHPQGSSA